MNLLWRRSFCSRCWPRVRGATLHTGINFYPRNLQTPIPYLHGHPILQALRILDLDKWPTTLFKEPTKSAALPKHANATHHKMRTTMIPRRIRYLGTIAFTFHTPQISRRFENLDGSRPSYTTGSHTAPSPSRFLSANHANVLCSAVQCLLFLHL